MPTKTLMIVGTTSSAGKSLLVTALCHSFSRRGVKVAPFKAQNMSNNAAVCLDGSEIGRAQYVQALAAGIEPTVEMNPILIKPEADSRAQVILMGRPWHTLDARDYYPRKDLLWSHITKSLDRLKSDYELVIIEGAGSPAELNLKADDIVNMRVAQYAQAPTLLVGDIDRGGIFAQLLGTYWLLPQNEQELIKGFIVNKFRGDISLFEDGIQILEDRSNVSVIGVVPYLYDLFIPEEDAVALENLVPVFANEDNSIDIAVIHLPRISNFDDFDPLVVEPGVRLRYVDSVARLGKPDAIILPGTKSTTGDLNWLALQGLDKAIKQYAWDGGSVVGICGGYQMLGRTINDPGNIESDQRQVNGLGLLSIDTTLSGVKATYQVKARIINNDKLLTDIGELFVEGYEIHMGRTIGESHWLEICQRNGIPASKLDGAHSRDFRIWGCYLHGLFTNHVFRRAWLTNLGWQKSGETNPQYDPFTSSLTYLTDTVESAIDIKHLETILWES